MALSGPADPASYTESIVMELVAASPNVQIEFQVSLPQNLYAAALLLASAKHFEGFGDWVTQTAANLTISLSIHLKQFAQLMGYCSGLWGELVALADQGVQVSCDSLMENLVHQPEVAFRQAARRGLDRRLVEWELAPAGSALSADASELAFLLARVWEQRQTRNSGMTGETLAEAQDLAGLIVDPGQLKDLLLSTVDELWKQVYRRRYLEDLSQIKRAVAYHQAQRYPHEFKAAFVAITGRAFPSEVEGQLQGVRLAVMTPARHIGPYLVLVREGQTLYIAFNADTAPRQLAPQERTGILYPPLKALADETRLQIIGLLVNGERYVGEIAELLDLSDSSASRHLNLLTAAGILDVRRENKQKFFRLDQDRMRALVADLQGLFHL